MSMRQFLSLLKQEWRLFYRRRSNILLVVMFIVIGAVACFNGVSLVNEEHREVTAKLSKDLTMFADKVALFKMIESGQAEPGQWNDPRKAHQAILHTKRPLTPAPEKLAYLSAEPHKLTPAILEVGTSTRHVNPKPMLGDPSNELYGVFDLNFVMVWLLPLFVIVMSYDVIIQDRALGSMPILLSQNVSLSSITFARLLIRYSVLVFILTLINIVSLIYLVSEVTISHLLVLGVWLMAAFCYMGVWFSLAAVVNTLTKNTATAGLLLLIFWVVFTFVVPVAVSSGAKHQVPPIDRHQVILDLRGLSNELNKKRQDVTSSYYAARPEINVNKSFDDEYSLYFVKTRYPAQLAFDKHYRPHSKIEERKRVQQAEFLRAGSFLSPTLAFKLLSNDLSGNAPERRQFFLQRVDEFQDRWRAKFDYKIASQVPLTLTDYKTKPDFEVKAEPVEKRIERLTLVISALVIYFVGLFLLAKFRLQRTYS